MLARHSAHAKGTGSLRTQKVLTLGALALALEVLIPIESPIGSLRAWAYQSREEYENALKTAERKVLRTQEAEERSGLGARVATHSVRRGLMGRDYRVGETWIVASWQEHPNLARRSAPASRVGKNGKLGLFQYRVIESKRDSSETTLEIRELPDPNRPDAPLNDSRVEKILIRIQNGSHQIGKSYVITGQAAPIQVFPDGIRSSMTSLELFALDFPEVETAERSKQASIPELPSGLAEALKGSELAPPDLSLTEWIEQDDLFGRRIALLWEKGSPWPAYLKTSNGVTVLLKKADP